MKHLLALLPLVITALWCPVSAHAYIQPTEVIVNDGLNDGTFVVDGIMYGILSHTDGDYTNTFGKNKVLVTCPIFETNCYSGDISIPSKIRYGRWHFDVVQINGSTFKGCPDLKRVSIPSSVTSIGSYAFAECPNLERVNIPNSVTYIGEGAFQDCTSLEKITIPKGVTYIGDLAFVNCTSLMEIIVPKSVTFVGENAFTGCYVAKGAFPYHDGTSAFRGNLRGTNLFCYTTNCIVDGTLIYGPDKSYLFYAGMYTQGDITIPESVTTICDNAFAWCRDLTSVTLNQNLRSIGEQAFSRSSITHIEIPNSVTSIGDRAFCGSYLESAVLGTGIETIDYGLFEECRNLSSITIPESVKSIKGAAFYWCRSLTSVRIPESVTSIGVSAFCATSLSEVHIPASVESIGTGALATLVSLQDITVDDANGYYASKDGVLYDAGLSTLVYYPNGRTGVAEVPDFVTSIEPYGFYECEYLTEVILPESVTEIGAWAFSGCVQLSKIEIPKGVSRLEDYTFLACRGLEEIVIPDDVVSIGGYGVFRWDSNLKRVEIGRSVSLIGDDAFSKCESLSEIVSRNPVPPVCGTNVFDEVDKPNCRLYVPAGSEEAYKAAPEWRDFNIVVSSAVAAVDADSSDVTFDVSADGLALHGCDGMAVSVCDAKGVVVYQTDSYDGAPIRLSAGTYVARVGSSAIKIQI